jgi:hypothetical protein
MVTIYFETEAKCDNLRRKQSCTTRKYYDKLTQSYYLILSSKFNLFNKEHKPNLRYLDESQLIYKGLYNIKYYN